MSQARWKRHFGWCARKGRLRVVPHFFFRDSRASETRARVKITPCEKKRPRVLPFLAWCDFHALSRFARPTIPEEKWGTTRNLFQTNMPESRQNNARHQLTNWSATFMQWTWEKPKKWTGNRRFFTPPPTSVSEFSPNRPYLSRSVGTGKREPWGRGCFSPCLAHQPKCRFHLSWLIKHLLSVLIPRAIRILTKKNIISLRVSPYGRSLRKESLR